jgi:cytochrome c-type biogenesis protein CcmE
VTETQSGDIGDRGGDLDLSPRTPAPTTSSRTVSSRRKWVSIGVLVAVLGAGVVIVTQFLRSAVDYYCNVDEIGVRDGCDAGRRLRVQGVVDEGTVTQSAGFTEFSISFNGVSLPVRYRGEPGGMFAECEPVVVHGRLGDDQVFAGDAVEVKHSNEYKEENPDRVEGSGPNCGVYDESA